MSKKKKAKAKAKAAARVAEICVHQEIFGMLAYIHPQGIPLPAANRILMSLALVAGEILSQAGDASAEGFFEVVRHCRARPPQHLMIHQGQIH